MVQSLFTRTESACARAAHAQVDLRTERRFQLIDVTAIVEERVRRSGVHTGTVCIQTRQPGAALLVTEDDEHLLEGVEAILRKRQPPKANKRLLDDLEAACPGFAVDDVKPKRRAHSRVVTLLASAVFNVVEGETPLRPFQCVFLVELCGPSSRGLSLVVSGVSPEAAL